MPRLTSTRPVKSGALALTIVKRDTFRGVLNSCPRILEEQVRLSVEVPEFANVRLR